MVLGDLIFRSSWGLGRSPACWGLHLHSQRATLTLESCNSSLVLLEFLVLWPSAGFATQVGILDCPPCKGPGHLKNASARVESELQQKLLCLYNTHDQETRTRDLWKNNLEVNLPNLQFSLSRLFRMVRGSGRSAAKPTMPNPASAVFGSRARYKFKHYFQKAGVCHALDTP